MASSPTQRTQTADSVAGEESAVHHEQPAATDGSRISSGTSVTTGLVEPFYAPSEERASQAV